MKSRAFEVNGEKRLARFSDCDKYRFVLEIQWDWALPYIQFIGLNPSTADEQKDDPTLRRVKSFAKTWGFGGVMMTNIFAWRDTNPGVLKHLPYPVAPRFFVKPSDIFSHLNFDNENDFWLYRCKQQCGQTVACWGKNGKIEYRGAKVKMLLPNMKCIRLLKDGQPEHPLYLPGDLSLIPFN